MIITNENDNFQFGSFFIKAGENIEPHKHINNLRKLEKTTEFLYIMSGTLEAFFYKDNHKFELIEKITMHKGSGLIIFDGIHSFKTSSDCHFFEIKQGPYDGNKDKIKLSIDV